MDEYVGGIATNYMTNANMLKKGLELLKWLEEDLENVGAEDYHQLMSCLLYTSPSPRDGLLSRMPSSA